MSNKEKIFDDYLKGNSIISQRYRSESVEHAPEDLRDKVLRKIEKVIDSEHEEKNKPNNLSWYVPASIAASLVICTGVALYILEPTERAMLQAPKEIEHIMMQSVEIAEEEELLDVEEVLEPEIIARPIKSTIIVLNTKEEWLDVINQLWEQGENDEAGKKLKEFLVEFPDYPNSEITDRLHKDINLYDYIEFRAASDKKVPAP